MELYSVRNELREPVKQWEFILPEHGALLFNCCLEYLDSISHYAPLYIEGTKYIKGLDTDKFSVYIKSHIPYFPDNMFYFRHSNMDQDSLLDFIEFISYNCKDYEENQLVDSQEEYLVFYKTSHIFNNFRNDINEILEKCNILFTLSENRQIERIIPTTIISGDIEKNVSEIKEIELQKLLQEAISLFRNRSKEMNKLAVEKIWGALERLKTYYTDLNKKQSANKIVEDISGRQADFKELFESEFKALTTIGNDFRIRHHETNKIDITDDKYYDYFFNRCLSLIALAIQYLD